MLLVGALPPSAVSGAWHMSFICPSPSVLHPAPPSSVPHDASLCVLNQSAVLPSGFWLGLIYSDVSCLFFNSLFVRWLQVVSKWRPILLSKHLLHIPLSPSGFQWLLPALALQHRSSYSSLQVLSWSHCTIALLVFLSPTFQKTSLAFIFEECLAPQNFQWEFALSSLPGS